MPERIQLRRTKGWRKPEGAVVVARPTKWGNPYAARREDDPRLAREYVTRLFREHLARPEQAAKREEIRAELRGQDLCCWRPLDHPCNADVLLEIANR